NAASSNATRITGLDRVGSPPGRVVFAAVTGRRGPAELYCRAARRRFSSSWRAISSSRYECIDVGPSPGDAWVLSARPVGGPPGGAAWLVVRPVEPPAGGVPCARTQP